MGNKFGFIDSCRVCGEKNPVPFFDLGLQPLANSLLKSSHEKEEFFPLALSRCSDCSLVQLNYTVDPKVLFSNYVWVTGSSRGVYDYAEKFYERVIAKAGIPKNGYVLEIASNDGTFLRPFKEGGYRVLGVDPAKNIAEIAEKNGIPTKVIFWSTETAKDLFRENGLADFVFARNVLPHVANTREFVEGLAINLKEGGTVVIEAHSARIILDELHYDSIYHEHLCYFTFKSLEKLLNDFGLFVFDIDKSPISGGSMVVYATKKRVKERPEVQMCRDEEGRDGVNTLSNWEGFAKRSFEHRKKLVELLTDKRINKKNIIGWGASARSSTMLNFCAIDSKTIQVIADSTPLKRGLYTAGTHILIESWEQAMAKDPDVVFVLAWNFAEEIIDILKNKFHFGGECIIPLPREPRVVKM